MCARAEVREIGRRRRGGNIKDVVRAMTLAMPVLRVLRYLALKGRCVCRTLIRCRRTHERHGELVSQVHATSAREGVRKCERGEPAVARSRPAVSGAGAVLGVVGRLGEKKVEGPSGAR